MQKERLPAGAKVPTGSKSKGRAAIEAKRSQPKAQMAKARMAKSQITARVSVASTQPASGGGAAKTALKKAKAAVSGKTARVEKSQPAEKSQPKALTKAMPAPSAPQSRAKPGAKSESKAKSAAKLVAKPAQLPVNASPAANGKSLAMAKTGAVSHEPSSVVRGGKRHLANGSVKIMSKGPITELPPDYRPSDKEPFMGELHRLYFRRKLLAWREEILRSTRETLQSLHEDQSHYADLADRATSESDKALELRARDRQRKLIAKIDAAMERIDRGTYGYCDETGEPISVKRLDARPIATLSIEAQERHERRERVYRDD